VRFAQAAGLPAVFLLFACLIAACLVPGCGDEESPVCPDQPIGLIQGFVLGGGKPVSCTLVAWPVDREDASSFQTSTDSTGWYELALPAGAYWLGEGVGGLWGVSSWYYSRDGYVWDSGDADTLIVGEWPVRADLIGGALTVSLAMPADTTEGWHFCRAYQQTGESTGAGSFTFRESATARSAQGTVTFEFPLLAAGTYALECVPHGESPIWLPPTLDVAAADRVIIEAGRSSVYSAQLPEPAVLVLETSGSWQTLNLNEPYVLVYSADSTQIDGIGISDAGTGRLSIRAPVSVKLHIEVGGVTRWHGGWTFAEAQTVTLTPGDPPVHIAYRESAILCTLVLPGLDIDHEVKYYLYDETGRCLTQSGLYPEHLRPAPLPNLTPGTYYIGIVPNYHRQQYWMPQWFDQQDSLASATPVVVAAEGIVMPVTMHVVVGGGISGRVREGDGTPYAGPLRVRSSADSGRDLQVVQTDELTGDYSVIGLPDGDYLLAIQFGWSRLCWYPGTMLIQEAEPVRIRNHARLTNVDWQIPPVKMTGGR
jgi:hypothetical protein